DRASRIRTSILGSVAECRADVRCNLLDASGLDASRLALLGGFLAAARLATFSYWTNTYYGGAVAVLGGALVLGALPRIKRQQRVRDALLMGLGLALLANTRPYESLFFCLPIAAVLLIWMFGRSAPPLLLSLRRVLLPLSLVLAITVGAMGYYFWRLK